MKDKVPERQENLFRKGNINFDLLQPELHEMSDGVSSPLKAKDKRGIFFKKEEIKIINKIQIFTWIALLFFSSASSFYIFLKGSSFIWLLFFPISILIALWSAVMLILIIARPR